MLTRSLHAQVILVLVILTITLLTQLLLTRENLKTLSANQKIMAHAYDNVGLVYELERDVIDLQRNLLIYKETASENSIQRFYTIVDNVDFKLKNFHDISGLNSLYDIENKLITRMSNHLTDYQDNFSEVINGRRKREVLIDEIIALLDVVKNIIDKNNKGSERSVIEAHLFVAKIGQSFYGYLNSFDSDYIDEFKAHIKNLQSVYKINKFDSKELNQAIYDLDKQFIRLTHVTRGYVYLVNVVMTGSANEILYLSEKIRKNVKSRKISMINNKETSSDQIQLNNNVIVLVSITIVLLIAWFLSKRILLPIHGITDVFRILSRGEEIDSIPSTDRKDEIGELAKAAKVFHDTNKKTHELLEHSQAMIANQEVMNIQLEEEKNKAEDAAKSKSMFLANMSHEIRTPMNGIVGLVDLVLRTRLTSKQKNYLNRIAFSGQIMMNVINDILDFSKIEAGKMEIECVEFEINTIIENLISAMAVRVREKDLDFSVEVSSSVPDKLLGDPLRISQILLNLCSNSIKFTEKGSVKVNVDYKNGFIHFDVLDTGIGMNENQKDAIFQSFTQADGSTSRKYGGTGLGLTIVKQLIKLMGGEIKLESVEEEGTQIYLKIESESSSVSKAISILNIEDKTIIYLIDYDSTQSKTAISDKLMLENFGLNIQLITLKENESLDLTQYHAPILIKTDRIEFIKMHQETIQQALKLERPIGFIMETSAYKLKHYIYDQWQLSALKHPYSPKQSRNYLLALYGEKQNSEIDENALEISHKYNGHVLLVEDNAINQLVAGDMLENLGLSYDLAEDGQSAIDKIEVNSEYDIVFMDIQMPIMDGYTATKALRDMGYDELIICGLSANALTEDLSKAKEVGMNDYLTKPMQIFEMEAVLNKYLNVENE